jgi:hypothetical protein
MNITFLRSRVATFTLRTTIAAVLVAAAAGCGSRAPRGAAAPHTDETPEFHRALDQARAAAAQDELSTALTIEGRIALSEPTNVHINRLLALEDKFIVSDFLHTRVESYARDGKWLGRIGRTGTAPGAYMFPTGLAALKDGHFAILDFKPARISVFDRDAKFVRSVVYTRHRFAGVQLAYARNTDNYYVFGAREMADKGLSGTRLVHRLSATGELGGSWIDRPAEKQAPWAASYYDPVVSVSDDRLLVAFPYSNEVHQITADGTSSIVARAYPEGARSPSRVFQPVIPGLKETTEAHYERFHGWRLHWTPIDGIAVVGDTLLVAVQTFSPLRYRLEGWSLTRHERLFTAQTNHQLMGTDAAGTVYFRASADLDKEHPDAIIAARLR